MASNELTVNGIKLSMVHPNYLHSNSTSHPWALGAMAELIDNAYDPDVGAKNLYIDKMERDGQLCLTFQDDGNGMDFIKLHQLLSFGYCDKTDSGRTYSHKPIGQYGNGFKSGSMRLGKDVIVFTRCETSASVGFLSQTYLQGINAESVLVPLLEYKVPTLTPIQRAGRESNLEAILEYSLYKSEEDLVAELTSLRAGTKIVIFNLKKINGRYELDFDFDPSDIRCPVAYVTEPDTNEERPVVVSSSHRRSLKEYYSILYYRPSSTNMEVFIRGRLVKLKLLSKTLKEKEEQFYKPKTESKQIRISIGFAPEEDTEDYGMLLYHKNRLIKAYERVGCQKQANGNGVGVIIVANVDFLTPTHTKQDFETDAKYNTVVGVFAKRVNDFWKNKREISDHAKGSRTRSKRLSGSSRVAENSSEATSVHHGRGSPAEMLGPLHDLTENLPGRPKLEASISNSQPPPSRKRKTESEDMTDYNSVASTSQKSPRLRESSPSIIAPIHISTEDQGNNTLSPNNAAVSTSMSGGKNCQTNNATADTQVTQENQLSENVDNHVKDDIIKGEVFSTPLLTETQLCSPTTDASSSQQASTSGTNPCNPTQTDGIAGCSNTQSVVETESEDVQQLKDKLSIQRLINDGLKRKMEDFRKNVHHLLMRICPPYDGTLDQVEHTVKNLLKEYKNESELNNST
ncbi:MORC family CW-type zinc finger protein 3-like isoform X2 [Physella acuta]|uniref:MORC family CW-type zinc finger protein 3-like isoform X2 n=1 Tax=Physella acuta TaxID=109671 RepID=UPI0027DAF4B8|nr:MORC family CW-type zinc finger protein 3-like isoform X2 [Physella acuta]